jgi:hypothetical protein
MTYSVNFWGSWPGTNDDCYTGGDYATLEAAEAVFNAPVADFHPPKHDSSDVQYVELVGPGTQRERKNPEYVPAGDHDDGEWTRELEREHLMLHGSLDR